MRTWTGHLVVARHRPMARLGAAAVVLTLALVGCGSGDADAPDRTGPTDRTGTSDGDPVPTAEQVAARTAHEHALGARLTADGTVPLDLALDLFATDYGPIAGGTADPALAGGRAGSSLRAVLARWGELTAAQRATVEEAVGPVAGGDDPPAQATSPTGGTAAFTTVSTTTEVDPSATSIPDVGPMISEVLNDLEELLGRTLRVGVDWDEDPDPPEPDWAMSATPRRGGRTAGYGRMDVCELLIYPWASARHDTEVFRSLLAHELMHCLQYDATDDVHDALDAPLWMIEGGAEFAAMTVAPSELLRLSWTSWLMEPEFPLTGREYSGLGAFATAEQVGREVWPMMTAVLRETSPRALEMLFGSSADEAMTTIAQTLVREPALGPAWEVSGRGALDLRGTSGFGIRVGSDVRTDVSITPFATSPYALELVGEVVDLQVHGAVGTVGLPGGRTDVIAGDFTSRYCVTGACTCPDDSDLGGFEIPHDGVIGLALTTTTGPPTEADFRVTVRTVDEACATIPAADVLTVRFSAPEEFVIRGGYCVLQASGDLLIQADPYHLPDGDEPSGPHPGATFELYKNPTGVPEGGSVEYTLDGTDATRYRGGSFVLPSADLLTGTFTLDDGAAGDWRCPRLLAPEEAFGGS